MPGMVTAAEGADGGGGDDLRFLLDGALFITSIEEGQEGEESVEDGGGVDGEGLREVRHGRVPHGGDVLREGGVFGEVPGDWAGDAGVGD